MFKAKHYEEEGILLNKNVRILLSIIELLSRYAIIPGIMKMLDNKVDQGNKKHELEVLL